jgi:hypothetical protein
VREARWRRDDPKLPRGDILRRAPRGAQWRELMAKGVGRIALFGPTPGPHKEPRTSSNLSPCSLVEALRYWRLSQRRLKLLR